ncbi:MAG: galactokinase [Termitinemataceae bacterium]|nr:MAG: galactokinase [Termitinemataceae bacterium]
MVDIALLHSKEFEVDDDCEHVIIAEAPGRLHFLGDHSQPNHGVFLCSGIDRSIRIAVSARKDTSLRFFTAETGERKRSSLANLHYKREDRWANYCKTALYIFGKLGFPLKGMNFTISGDVPRNISLAASCAMEVASAIALRRFFGSNLSDDELILKLTESHSEFYEGENCFIDYLAIINAKKDHFLVIDEENAKVAKIKNPFAKHKILLLDSRVPLIDVASELKNRNTALEKGFKTLSAKKKGSSLKDYKKSDLDDLMGSLSEEVRRRCQFVIQENERVIDIAKSIKDGSKESFAKTLYHSHEGLRDLLEVSCPEIDWLVKRAQETPGIIGARMTGKGFGGCVFVILPSNLAEDYESKMDDYERIFGFRPITHELRPSGAAKLIAK